MNQSLDTNVVLRLIIGDVPVQRDQAQALVESAPYQFEVADVVFVELEYALRTHYGLTRQQVSVLLLGFASHPKINCNKQLLTAVFSHYQKCPALSFTDICVAMYAQLNNAAPLWTFDKKLARQLESTQLVESKRPSGANSAQPTSAPN